MDAELVELSVLGQIMPSKKEMDFIDGRASRLLKIARDYYAERNIPVEVRYAGSYAKDTYLADPDLDLFMLFPTDMPREEMTKIGLQAGRDIIGGELVYSEHPYTTGRFEGVEVDMVPCYKLESTEKLQTAVDRTPFHTEYILSHLDFNGRDQVRLLKKFMKACGTYGAEQDTRGFSGYLCEVLIVKYGSFLKVLEESQSWEKYTSISIGESGPHIKETLVFYDPVDIKRNVASAVHEETMEKFKRAAKAYLAEPDERFFFPNRRVPLAYEELEWICSNKRSRLASVVFMKPKDVVDDNLQGQLWKSQYALIEKMESCEFKVRSATHSLDEYRMTIVFELESDVLPETYKHFGPPTKVKTSENFLEKWKDNPYGEPFIEDGKWAVIADRPIRTAEEFLYKRTATSGIGRSLVTDTMTVYGHDMTLQCVDPMLLTELLDPKDPWEI